jgi:hypothetical protein
MANNPNFCPKCGSPLAFGGTFCASCGTEITPISQPTTISQNIPSQTSLPQSPFQQTETSQTNFPQTKSSQTIPFQPRSSQTISPQSTSQAVPTQMPLNGPVPTEFADLIINARGVSSKEVEDLFTQTFNNGTAKMTYCIVLLVVSLLMLRMGFYWGGLGICMICYFFSQYNEERRSIIHLRPEAAIRGFYMRFLKKKYIVSAYSDTKMIFAPSDGSKMYLPILFTMDNGKLEMRAMKQHIKQFDMLKKKF